MAGLHHDWGLKPYAEVHALQERLVLARAEGRVPDVLLTGEHPPVVTLGRKTPPGGTYPDGVEVVAIERGGEATYHGPGQVVAYPIVHLTRSRRNLHEFQRDLEEVGLRTLADFGLEGRRREGLTGVWIGTRKVQSLGIAVRRWVTWHGLALNVTTDLAPFRAFHPCGLDGDVMTSMQEVLAANARGTRDTDAPLDLEAVKARLVAHLSDVLPGGPFQAAPLPRDILGACP